VHLKDAIKARADLNGREISGSVVKIGFAKVPAKGDSVQASTPSSTNSVVNSGPATASLRSNSKPADLPFLDSNSSPTLSSLYSERNC
jgi:hypothetical protein